MARVVSCNHCGAPHHLARSQTRFDCEWCGGANLGANSVAEEELVAVGGGRTGDAEELVRSVLRRRGVRAETVDLGEQRWTALWQVCSSDGDEFVGSAMRDSAGLDRGMVLPAAAMTTRKDFEENRAGRAGGATIPARPDLVADEAVAAARSAFERPDAEVESLRLVWVAVREFRARANGVVVDGVCLPDLERVVLGGIPARATDGRPVVRRLGLHAAFLVTALVLGVAVEGAFARALALSALVLAMFGAMLLSRTLPRLARNRGRP